VTKLTVSTSPHIHHEATTSRIMLDVLIALIPAFAAAIMIFGVRAAAVTCVCVASCVFFEWIFEKITKREKTIGDYSACITGVLLAFNLPVTIPIWQAVFGSAVAIILVKQLFGGLGKNFANPAITARVVMFLAFSATMTNWASPYAETSWWIYPIDSVAANLGAAGGAMDALTGATAGADAVTGATPLVLLGQGRFDALPSVWHMILGVRGGSLGETSNIALLIGGIYLMARRVISWHTPLTYIAVVTGLSGLLGAEPVYHMLAGGLFLGAFFMATDYVTAPQTNLGRIIFGAGAGLFTVLFRIYGNYPEGVSFAILLMNILTPYINRITETKPLGAVKS